MPRLITERPRAARAWTRASTSKALSVPRVAMLAASCIDAALSTRRAGPATREIAGLFADDHEAAANRGRPVAGQRPATARPALDRRPTTAQLRGVPPPWRSMNRRTL